ncbi:hypothetical protein YC2023_023835 [Brassica napus]
MFSYPTQTHGQTKRLDDPSIIRSWKLPEIRKMNSSKFQGFIDMYIRIFEERQDFGDEMKVNQQR